MRTHGLIPLLANCLLSTGAGQDAAKNDLEKFQGDWILVSAERDGQKLPEEEARKLKLTIQGDRFTLRKDAVVLSEGTFKLDPGKKPKQIDETISSGFSKGKVMLAIYEIDGDHHKICFPEEGKGRPTSFSSLPGSGQLLQFWKRVKK